MKPITMIMMLLLLLVGCAAHKPALKEALPPPVQVPGMARDCRAIYDRAKTESTAAQVAGTAAGAGGLVALAAELPQNAKPVLAGGAFVALLVSVGAGVLLTWDQAELEACREDAMEAEVRARLDAALEARAK